jgi:hypothetical protein
MSHEICFFYFCNVLLRRLRHRHRIFVRSRNTICDFNRLLYRRSPYYFYASSIASGGSSASAGRVATGKRHTPDRFYFDMRPSALPLRGNLLDVKRFSTFLMFLSLLSGNFAGCSVAARQLLYRLSLYTFVRAKQYILAVTVPLSVTFALLRND